MSALDRADAFARWWVRRYTAALPAEVAQRRRGEIRSDVWEHRVWATQAGAAAPVVALAIGRRVVTGMAQDVRWRRAQLATVRGVRSAVEPTGWSRVRRTWWQALALLLGAVQFATGAIAPFEQPPGDAVTVVVNTCAGLVVFAGLLTRRSRRVRGDLLIAAGVVPVVPWFWTYVFPVAAVTVMAAALVDAADASATSPGVDQPGDRGRATLVAALVTATIGAVMIGGADAAIVLVSPVLAALIIHAVIRRHRHRPPLTRVGLFALGTGLGSGVLTVLAVVVSAPDGLSMSTGAVTAAAAVTAAGVIAGAALLVAGARGPARRWGHPAAVDEPRLGLDR